jgi:hypothetical protein
MQVCVRLRVRACVSERAGQDGVRNCVGVGGDDTRVSHHDDDQGLGWVVISVEAAVKARPWFDASTNTCAPTCWGSRRRHDEA